MGLIVAIFENMQGNIDSDLGELINFIVEELQFLSTVEGKASKFKSTTL